MIPSVGPTSTIGRVCFWPTHYLPQYTARTASGIRGLARRFTNALPRWRTCEPAALLCSQRAGGVEDDNYETTSHGAPDELVRAVATLCSDAILRDSPRMFYYVALGGGSK
jgi:hypothetical protein